MLDIRFKKCCYTCDHRKTKVEEGTMWCGMRPYIADTKIYCEHREVCKEYRESDKEE